MKSKVIASKFVNDRCISVEYRYNEMGICTGLFLCIFSGLAKEKEQEMPSECTAMDMFNELS